MSTNQEKTTDDKHRRAIDKFDTSQIDPSLVNLMSCVMDTNSLVCELKIEFEGLKTEVGELKKEIMLVKNEVTNVKDDLKEHMDLEEIEKKAQTLAFREMLERIDDVSNLKNAFIKDKEGNPDVHGHQNYHLVKVDEATSWNSLKQTAKTKVMEHMVTFIIMIFGLGIFAFIQNNTHQQAPMSQEEQAKMITESIQSALKSHERQGISSTKKKDDK